MLRYFFAFNLIFSVLMAYGQSEQNATESVPDSIKYVQVFGALKGKDSLESVSFATIRINKTYRGTVANYEGYFTLVARPGDTLNFQHLAYVNSYYIVPEDSPILGEFVYHFLETDTIFEKTVDVYPWPSREDFAAAIINLKLDYEDAMTRAERHLSGANMAKLSLRITPDAGISQNSYAAYNRQQLIYKGQAPSFNVLNPIAWAQFIKALQNGELKRE